MRTTDGATAATSDLCNVVYDLLLQMIVRYFPFGDETDDQLQVLAGAAVRLMVRAVEPLGLLLARLPVGPENPGAAAGENFQLAYRSNFLIPHRRAAWIRFWERLDEAADFAVGIRGLPHGREVLHGVAASLRSVSQELAEHTADE